MINNIILFRGATGGAEGNEHSMFPNVHVPNFADIHLGNDPDAGRVNMIFLCSIQISIVVFLLIKVFGCVNFRKSIRQNTPEFSKETPKLVHIDLEALEFIR